jgi:hypothetical protein
MNRKTVLALIGATSIAALTSGGALAASSAGPAVKVQVKTPAKTLVNATVHGETGKVRGKCSGDSGAGALDAATHGKWKGSYSAKYHDFFVTSILGVKPKSPHYWAILVNGKTSSTGMCGIKLKAGEKILFKVK